MGHHLDALAQSPEAAASSSDDVSASVFVPPAHYLEVVVAPGEDLLGFAGSGSDYKADRQAGSSCECSVVAGGSRGSLLEPPSSVGGLN